MRFAFHGLATEGHPGPDSQWRNRCSYPWKQRDEENGDVKPKGLDVLEFGSEVAFEIVLDDEDAEEIRVAAGAEDVPGKSGEAEGRDGGGMKEAESITPPLGEERPEKDCAAGENNGRRALCEDSEAEEETEKDESKPGCSRKDRRVFVAREAQDDRGADHGDRDHRAKGHVGGGGVRKADHADGGRKQKQ